MEIEPVASELKAESPTTSPVEDPMSKFSSKLQPVIPSEDMEMATAVIKTIGANLRMIADTFYKNRLKRMESP